MEVLSAINWGILLPFLIIQTVLIIVAFIDWIKLEKTNGPKWVWLLIILFVSTFGPILYFIFGRRRDM